MQGLQTTDNLTGKLRQNYCIDNSGNVFQNITAAQINGITIIDGSNFAKTDIGIQSGVNSASDGGEVYLPSGTYQMTGTGSCQVTISKRLTLHGAGFSTLLQVGSSVPATTDVICFKPPTSASVQGGHFYDFQIQPASGTPARHGIAFDGTNGAYSNLEIDHIAIFSLGSTALAVINAASLATGTPFTSTFHDNIFNGGMDLTNGGDNIAVIDNVFAGGAGSIIISLTPTGHSGVDGGAHSFMFKNNNVTINGMLQIINAWTGSIENNNLEQGATSTNPDNCVIDVQGNTSPGPIQGLVIRNNYIGANSSFVGCAVRVDRAKGTLIRDNYVVQGSVNAFTFTVNADRTYFGYNRMAPDNPINSFLSDSGTNTSGDFLNQSTGVVSHYGTQGYTNAGGTTGLAITNTTIGVNPTNGRFCSTSGDPSSTACQAAFTSSSSNTWLCGNGTFGDTSCLFVGGTLNPRTGLGFGVSDILADSVTSPTIANSGCGGAAASISSSNGTTSFKINVGTTPGSACTFTMPTATTGWNVKCDDITTQSTSVFVQKQTGAESTTSVTITNFSDVAVPTAFVASDILKCTARAD